MSLRSAPIALLGLVLALLAPTPSAALILGHPRPLAVHATSRPDADSGDGSRGAAREGSGVGSEVMERAQGPPAGGERQAGSEAAGEQELDGECSEG